MKKEMKAGVETPEEEFQKNMAEDQEVMEEALEHLKISKALTLMQQTSKAHATATKAYYLIDKLLKKRTDYEVLQAPFFFKVGDSLGLHVELNTDELGEVKDLSDIECGSD